MKNTTLAPIVLLTFLLAGCAEPQSTAPTASTSASIAPATTQRPITPPGATTYAWGITACAFAIVAVPVDEDALAGHLPPGFTLSPTRFSGLPAGPRAAIELDAYACEAGVGLNGTLQEVDYGSYYASVRPPEALREDGYDAYFVKWDVLVPDTPRRDVLAQGGLPVHAGSADVTMDAQGGTVQVELSFADGGGFRFVGSVGPPDALDRPLPFMEYTPLATPGTLARWHARLHNASIGEGVGQVEVLPGSWVADLVGAGRSPATVIAGRWNLDEADVTFPLVWPPPAADENAT